MAPSGRQSRAGTTVPQKDNPAPARPSTRSVQTPLPDIVGAQDQEVRDAETGRKFLDKAGYTENEGPMTLHHLSSTLFYVSQVPSINPFARSAIRAAAFLTREASLTGQAEELIARIIPPIERSVISAIAPQMAKILSASDNMEQLNAKFQDSLTRFEQSTSVPSTQQQGDEEAATHPSLTGELEAIKAGIAELKDHISINANASPPPPLPSSLYRNALLSQSPATPTTNATRMNDQARANAARKERQLLVDIDLNHPVSNSIRSREELISLFQKAIAEIKEADAPDITIKSLSILRNGGILMEFPSKQAVQWLKQDDRLQRLATASGGNLAFKNRLYNIVVPFVPTTTTLETPETLRAIEEENELPSGVISMARWIKPPQRREAEQRVAHALFRMTTPEAANQLISEGMYVNLERLRPVKDKKEPLRCLKCQQWGHMARDCKDNRDTCGTCAKNHRTNACPSYKTPHCVSCDSDSHASWNRSCPEFKRRSQALDETTPENGMPYFPTEEAWTQAHLPPRPSGRLAPTRPPNPARKPQAAKQSTQRLLTGYIRPHQATHTHAHPSSPPSQSQQPARPPSTQPTEESAGQPTSTPMPVPTPADTPAPAATPTPTSPDTQGTASSRPSTPTPGQPAPFPPISPLNHPPPMPTPPAFMANPTQADPSASPSRNSHV